jgi:hypothetical protein
MNKQILQLKIILLMCAYIAFKYIQFCNIRIYLLRDNHEFTFSFSGPVYEKLQKCGLSSNTINSFKAFPTVHDAVIFAQSNLNKSADIRV